MDGYVKIGTSLDTKQLDNDLKIATKKLEKYEREATKLSTVKEKAEINLQAYEKEKQLIQEVTNGSLKYSQSRESVTNELFTEKKLIEELNTKYSTQLNKLQEINQQINTNKDNQNQIKEKVIELNQELSKSQGIDAFKKSIGSAGKKVDSVIKKLGKWVLSIFAISTAYSAVTKAMSTLSNYNDQIKTDLEYIQFAIASALQPLVEKLIELAYQLLGYVALIAKSWFNIDIFANSSSNAFKKGNEEAKKLQRTMAGFDEMNVLSDNNSSTSSVAPSIDLSNIDTNNVPDWLQWILDNGDKLKKIIVGIAGAIVGMKILAFVGNMGSIIKIIKNVIKSFTLFKTGIGLMIGGFILMIKGIADMILHWDELDGKQKIWRVSMALLGGAMITLGYAIATGISVATLGIGAAIALITGIVTALVILIDKFVNEEDAIKDVTTAQNDLNDAQDEYVDANNNYIDAVDNSTEAFKKLNDIQEKTGISGQDLYDKVENGVLDYKDMTEEQKNVYKAYLDNIEAEKNLKTSTEELTEAKTNEKIASWENKLALADEKGEYNEYRDSVVEAYKKGELSAEEARTLIEKAMTGMSTASKKTFAEDLPRDIAEGLDSSKYETSAQKLKNWFDDLLTSIKQKIKENPIKFTLEGVANIATLGGFSRVKEGYKNLFSKTGALVLPKLASGGIINMPNRGIPVGKAIGGESGAEGVIPLTDSQAMETLGSAIGKYITINAIIENKMNGRILNRELQKVNNNSNFATNR